MPKGLRRPKRDQVVLAGRIAGIEFEKAVMELAQALSSADGPRVDVEEHRKLRDPLLEERSQVHQHERVPPSFGNHANPRHRLAHARRRDQHSDVMGPERAHGNRNNRELVTLDKCSGSFDRSRYLGEAPNGPHSVVVLGDLAIVSYPEREGLIFLDLTADC